MGSLHTRLSIIGQMGNKNMETTENCKTIEKLIKIIQLQKELINNQQKTICLYDKYIENSDKLLAECRQKLSNTRWIAILEFLTLFMETKGEIYDSVYFRSAFSLVGLPLTEKNLLWMIEYAINHLEHDAKCTKQIMER